MQAEVPAVLFNREVVGEPSKFDVELLGNCDAICTELWKRLDWPALTVKVAGTEKEKASGESKGGGEGAGAEGVRAGEEGHTFVEPNRYLFQGFIQPRSQDADSEEKGDGQEEGKEQKGGEGDEGAQEGGGSSEEDKGGGASKVEDGAAEAVPGAAIPTATVAAAADSSSSPVG
jgi:hypothetical protein